MQLYTSSTDVTNIYNELANKGLIDASIINPEQLFPPLKSNKNPQDFISAPGSGYASIILILEDFQLIQQPIYLFLKV